MDISDDAIFRKNGPLKNQENSEICGEFFWARILVTEVRISKGTNFRKDRSPLRRDSLKLSKYRDFHGDEK